MLKKRRPITPGLRHRIDIEEKKKLADVRPEKSLREILQARSGRNNKGKVTIRHRGGRQKRFLRKIDFKRDKKDIKAVIKTIEYDPNRGANVALAVYKDGEKRYILAPEGLKVNTEIVSSEKADLKVGNCLPLKKIPVGTPIHNLEITPGGGGQMVRGAGTAAFIQSKEKNAVLVKLPSGEIRKFSPESFATLGQIGNLQLKNIQLGKAGRKRLMGWRPSVRGVAMHPGAHPHGGGEGRSGIGMPSPKSPWGKKTLGKKTRKRKKYSNKLIIKRRK